jgi:flagellar biosynthesis/type III secretory pathway M-ring protein FliF/YscJ
MTIRMDEAEVIAAAVGTGIFALVAILVAAWLLYLLVRPSRRRKRRELREQRQRAAHREPQDEALSTAEAAQMLRVMERMEERLAVLERLVTDDSDREERILEAGESPELRRIK